jgi:hypothetical protein
VNAIRTRESHTLAPTYETTTCSNHDWYNELERKLLIKELNL